MTDVKEKTKPAPAKKKQPGADELLQLVQSILDDRKAEEIAVIDLRGKTTIGDYMVVASGQSSRQVVTLSDYLVKELKSAGLSGIKPEGAQQGDWVLIDAGDVIIHLFRPEVRAFYNLEKMWETTLSEAEQPTHHSN